MLLAMAKAYPANGIFLCHLHTYSQAGLIAAFPRPLHAKLYGKCPHVLMSGYIVISY
jgi:hypothetical protein